MKAECSWPSRLPTEIGYDEMNISMNVFFVRRVHFLLHTPPPPPPPRINAEYPITQSPHAYIRRPTTSHASLLFSSRIVDGGVRKITTGNRLASFIVLFLLFIYSHGAQLQELHVVECNHLLVLCMNIVL